MTSPLEYRAPGMITRPGRVRVVGAVSVFVGAVELAGNAFFGATMFKQLLKQWGYIPAGAATQSMNAWLVCAVALAALGAAWAAFAIVIGTLTLRRSSRGQRLHVIYAWGKLPLAALLAACIGWGMPFFGLGEPSAIAAGSALALIAGAAYPVVLLSMFGRRGKSQ